MINNIQYYGVRGAGIYPETESAMTLLKYDLINTGCCKIISHPLWGTSCYPATLFTNVPLFELKRILSEIL